MPRAARRDTWRNSTPRRAPGAEETLRAVREKYWWWRMPTDIAEWVRSCQVCAAIKVGRPQSHASLRPSIHTEPWVIVSLDVLGPSDDVALSHRFLLVLTDIFSRWVEAKPVGRANPTQIDFMEETFNRFGYPAHVIPDSAPMYKSRAWERYLSRHHIASFESAIYHQRTQSSIVSKN